jgi:hypothetical protein
MAERRDMALLAGKTGVITGADIPVDSGVNQI